MNPRSSDEIVITGIGAVTSTGNRTPQVMASIRADICRFAEFPAYKPMMRDPWQGFPEPFHAAPASHLTDGLSGIERLLALGRPALEEALADAGIAETDLPATDLLVATAQRSDTALGSRIATILAPRLASLPGGPLAFASLRCLPAGSAGALVAMETARKRLVSDECRFCVVGGVDSWLDPQTLAELDQARRLKTSEIQDGFIPGEAAGFVVLERAYSAARRKHAVYARCSEVQMAQEPNTLATDSVCTGQGLTDCLRPVAQGLRRRGSPLRAVLCDLNGESYRATEWAYAQVRAFDDGFPCPPTLLHPADCVGDVGAATGALLLGFGAWMVKRHPDQWNASLIWCSSDKGERAACAVEGA